MHAARLMPSAVPYARTWCMGEAELGALRATGPTGAFPEPQNRWIAAQDLVRARRLALRARPWAHPPVWRRDDGAATRAPALASDDAPPFELHEHQVEAVRCVLPDAYTAYSGIVVIGCGGGKTAVGVEVARALRLPTVVITIHRKSQQQWREAFASVGVPCHVHGVDALVRGRAQLRPPVVCLTYAALARAARRESAWDTPIDAAHLIFCDEAQLVICDEVHCAPAQTFQHACRLPALVKIGLTGSLVREDDGISELLRLVGPVLFEHSAARLSEDRLTKSVRSHVHLVPLSAAARSHAEATGAGVTAAMLALDRPKMECVRGLFAPGAALASRHALVFCDVLVALPEWEAFFRTDLGAVVFGPVHGGTPPAERESLVRAFEAHDTGCVLLITKVGSMAIDFQRADALLQLTQTSGSRNDQQQRVGRVARRLACARSDAVTYTVAVEGTREERFARRRAAHLFYEDGQRTTFSSCEEDVDAVGAEANVPQAWMRVRLRQRAGPRRSSRKTRRSRLRSAGARAQAVQGLVALPPPPLP